MDRKLTVNRHGQKINSKTDMDRTSTVKQTWTEHEEFQ